MTTVPDLQGLADNAAPLFGEMSQPSLVGQFSEHDESWDLADWLVKVYDLSDETHVKEYEELLALSSQKDPSIVIVEQERQFCQNSENWKIFVTCALVNYTDLVDKK